jgi:hypothetical protein
MSDNRLSISTPVDNDKVVILELLSKEEAEEIIESFRLPGMDWIEWDNKRNEVYTEIVKKGNRKEIAEIANTLMREKLRAEGYKRRLYEKDRLLLTKIQNILFSELAFSLNTTCDVIDEKNQQHYK